MTIAHDREIKANNLSILFSLSSFYEISNPIVLLPQTGLPICGRGVSVNGVERHNNQIFCTCHRQNKQKP